MYSVCEARKYSQKPLVRDYDGGVHLVWFTAQLQKTLWLELETLTLNKFDFDGVISLGRELKARP